MGAVLAEFAGAAVAPMHALTGALLGSVAAMAIASSAIAWFVWLVHYPTLLRQAAEKGHVYPGRHDRALHGGAVMLLVEFALGCADLALSPPPALSALVPFGMHVMVSVDTLDTLLPIHVCMLRKYRPWHARTLMHHQLHRAVLRTGRALWLAAVCVRFMIKDCT